MVVYFLHPQTDFRPQRSLFRPSISCNDWETWFLKSQKLDFIHVFEAYNACNQIEKMKEKMRWVLTSCLDGRDSVETHDTLHNMYCIMWVLEWPVLWRITKNSLHSATEVYVDSFIFKPKVEKEYMGIFSTQFVSSISILAPKILEERNCQP